MHKLTLAVCPHDTAENPERWFLFAQFLSRHLDEARIEFRPVDGFAAFRETMPAADLVYANPQDGHELCTHYGYRLLARPGNRFDEVVIIGDWEAPEAGLAAIHGSTVATVPELLPTCQALAQLAEIGARPAAFLPCDSWLAVVNSVARGQAPFGFVYRDFFDGLGRFSQRMVRVVDRGDTQVLQHAIVLSPAAEPHRRAFSALLGRMHEDEQGRECLDALSISRWETPREAMLEHVGQLRAGCRLESA